MSQNLCTSFLGELLEGIHVFGTDVFKLALYLPAANLDPTAIMAYTAANETAGAGYVAGGSVLVLTPGFPMPAPSGAPKWLIDFADVVYNPGIFNARYGLIYNSSKANRAVAVIDFGLEYFAGATFTITWPPNDEANCLLQFGA